MPRRRFSTPAKLQQPKPLRHTLVRARSDEGWMLLERGNFEVYLPALPTAWSTDGLPLSHQPSIQALTHACADADSLSSVEADVGHLTIPVRTSSLEIARRDSESGVHVRPSLDVVEMSRSSLDAPNVPSKFVYKTPSFIIHERDCFPFRPAILVQAPTPPRAVSGPNATGAFTAPPLTPPSTIIKEPAPLPFPLVPRDPSITSIPSLSAASLHSTLSPSISSPPPVPTHLPPPVDTTPRELAERSERVQTLSDSVMRSRAYSALMNRHCETLSVALESTAELQDARAEIVRLKSKVAQYRAVNRTLVDWGMRLREENEVLRAEAGDAPGVVLFDPERHMRSRDDDEGYELGEKGYEEDSWRIDEGDEEDEYGYDEGVF